MLTVRTFYKCLPFTTPFPPFPSPPHAISFEKERQRDVVSGLLRRADCFGESHPCSNKHNRNIFTLSHTHTRTHACTCTRTAADTSFYADPRGTTPADMMGDRFLSCVKLLQMSRVWPTWGRLTCFESALCFGGQSFPFHVIASFLTNLQCIIATK